MITEQALLEARRTRLLVCVAFHFVLSRIPYLFDVVRTLAEYPVERIDIVILTSEGGMLSSVLTTLCDQLSMGQVVVSLRRAGPLEHPYYLTWEHKAVIREMLAEKPIEHTHFIYLESDIRLSFLNFCYFLDKRESLARHGCIPSFLRMEFHPWKGTITATDQQYPTYVDEGPDLTIEQTRYVFLGNPYCGLFILDRGLAEEHESSRSFDRIASEAVWGWGVRERAAMGLCFENLAPGYPMRWVIPVDRFTLLPERFSLVHHLPNNYALNEIEGPDLMFGKIQLHEVVQYQVAQ